MPWFYNSYSGELTNATGLDALAYEAAIHTGTGWHELKIPDSDTEAQAAADAEKEVPGGATPTTSLTKGLGQAATTGLPQWALHVTGLTPYFIRGLKILFGGVLIILGIAKLTGADNTIVQLAGKIPVIP